MQERPSIWSSISEAEEGDDDLEHFQDRDTEKSMQKPEPPSSHKELSDKDMNKDSPDYVPKLQPLVYDMQKR